MSEDAIKWMNDKIKDFDIFGKTLIPKYNTKLGGIMSLIILVVSSYATVMYLKAVSSYSEISFNKNEKKLTLANNQEIYNFASDKGIKLAFHWVALGGSIFDETYGAIRMVQHSYDDCISGDRNCYTANEIPLVPCNFSEFSEQIPDLNYTDFPVLCPSHDSELALQSNVFGKNQKYIDFHIQR